MSYFKLSNGQVAQGRAEAAFIPDFGIIPNNTMALATLLDIKEAEDTYKAQSYYNITWKLLNDPFAARIVNQKIYFFEPDPKKSDRAKEMLTLILKICNVVPQTPAIGLTDVDFSHMRNKICGVLIREWSFNGREGNSVAEVHPAAGFVERVGTKLEPKPETKSRSRTDERNPPPADDLDDDIPF